MTTTHLATTGRVPLDLAGIPPHSDEAEQVVLGSSIAASGLLPAVMRVAPPDAWYEPRHATILTTLAAMQADGVDIAVAGIVIRLRDAGELDKIGGAEYIVRLTRQASPVNAMYYAEIMSLLTDVWVRFDRGGRVGGVPG